MIHPFTNKIEILNTKNAKGFKLAETSLNEIVLLQIKKGVEIPTHPLPVNVVFYVTKGKGEITIEEDTFSTQKGDVIEVKANLQRSWMNNTSESLELLVIKEKI